MTGLWPRSRYTLLSRLPAPGARCIRAALVGQPASCSEAAEALLRGGGAGGDHTQHVEAHGLGQRPARGGRGSTVSALWQWEQAHPRCRARTPLAAKRASHQASRCTPHLTPPPRSWTLPPRAHRHWPMMTVSPSLQRKQGLMWAEMLVWRFSYLRTAAAQSRPTQGLEWQTCRAVPGQAPSPGALPSALPSKSHCSFLHRAPGTLLLPVPPATANSAAPPACYR